MRLWVCSLGYWVVVTVADDEDAALEIARRIRDREEGWDDADHEWTAMPSPDPDGAAVGWV